MSTPEQLMREMEKYSHLMLVNNVTISETFFNYFDVNFKWFMQVFESFSRANPAKELEGLSLNANSSANQL